MNLKPLVLSAFAATSIAAAVAFVAGSAHADAPARAPSTSGVFTIEVAHKKAWTAAAANWRVSTASMNSGCAKSATMW